MILVHAPPAASQMTKLSRISTLISWTNFVDKMPPNQANPATPPIEQAVTFLYTQNLAETARFYEQTLGLPLVLDQGSCRIYAAAPNVFLGFCQQDEAPHPQGVIFTFVTQNVDGWHDYLQTQNVPIEKPPTLNEIYKIYHIFVRDPNGYLLEFQRFLDPSWPTP